MPVKRADKTTMPVREPERRAHDFGEVNEGYTPFHAAFEAERCLRCQDPVCVDGCPVRIPIPDFIHAIAVGDMTIALIATVLGVVTANYAVLFGALAVGASVGLILAKRVQMTQMPELVAILHSLVGMAAVLVGFANFMGVHMLESFLKGATNPKWTGEIVFQPMAPHCWGPRGPELAQKVVAQIDKYAPAGADLKSWKY